MEGEELRHQAMSGKNDLIEAETASGPRSANTSQTIFELLGGVRMSSSYLAYSLSHVSCPYASTVDAVLSLIVGGARILVEFAFAPPGATAGRQ